MPREVLLQEPNAAIPNAYSSGGGQGFVSCQATVHFLLRNLTAGLRAVLCYADITFEGGQRGRIRAGRCDVVSTGISQARQWMDRQRSTTPLVTSWSGASVGPLAFSGIVIDLTIPPGPPLRYQLNEVILTNQGFQIAALHPGILDVTFYWFEP